MPAEKEVAFGLRPCTLEKLRAVFSRHPEVERVILYGSRAKGDFRPGSDIDLTIYGEAVTLSQLLRIEHEVDELLLPYKIDLSLHHKIDSPDLREHIERVGKVFYERANR